MSSRTVTSMEDLKNALNEDVDNITIEGSVAKKIAKKYHGNSAGSKAANASIVLGLFFTPLFIAGAVGKVMTHKLNKYQIDVISDNKVKLTIKDSTVRRFL